jgi:hypothetical protein
MEDADKEEVKGQRSLLRRYQKGELTSEQLQTEARAAGYSRLEPDPTLYDPEIEPLWTLPMALAWVIYRSFDQVRPLMDSYRAASLTWRRAGHRQSEERLLPPLRKSVPAVVADAENERSVARREIAGKEARDDLLRRLKSGALAAFGIPPNGSELSPIPATIWETTLSRFAGHPGG